MCRPDSTLSLWESGSAESRKIAHSSHLSRIQQLQHACWRVGETIGTRLVLLLGMLCISQVPPFLMTLGLTLCLNPFLWSRMPAVKRYLALGPILSSGSLWPCHTLWSDVPEFWASSCTPPAMLRVLFPCRVLRTAAWSGLLTAGGAVHITILFVALS
jgi:hypothetical protein